MMEIDNYAGGFDPASDDEGIMEYQIWELTKDGWEFCDRYNNLDQAVEDYNKIKDERIVRIMECNIEQGEKTNELVEVEIMNDYITIRVIRKTARDMKIFSQGGTYDDGFLMWKKVALKDKEFKKAYDTVNEMV